MPKLPPDPENMNKKRALWASVAVKTFMSVTGTNQQHAVSDLIADLGHYCDRHDLDYAGELACAANHYQAETKE